MPYITTEERKVLLEGLQDAETPGQLNYIFTSIIAQYLKDKGLRYQTINDIYGALEGAKLEFSRRVVNGYEDGKLKENGDVY